MYSIETASLLLIARSRCCLSVQRIQGYRSSTDISSRTYDGELKVIAQGLVPISLSIGISLQA